MDRLDLESRIIDRGKEFFATIRGESPSIFDKGWWTGKVMDWSMRNEGFKVQLFRFVDVLPYLTTGDSLSRHIQEYFADQDLEIPSVFKWGAKTAGLGGRLTGRMIAGTLRSNIETMARQFIIGQTTKDALKTLSKLRKSNFAFTVDILGEATVSENEAEHYQESYLELLDELDKEKSDWKGLGDENPDLDWGYAPKIYVSVKPSTLYSQAEPADFEGSIKAISGRFEPILTKARKMGAFVRIDMEQYKFKDITLEVFRRLREKYRDYPHLGIVLQSYLRDTDRDLDGLLEWARKEALPCSIRLVKGAYWDYETVVAKQNGWQLPVYTIKAETDAAFERQAQRILENHDVCHLACGSHNIRSIAAVMEMARALKVPDDRYEFQVLFGMAEPIRTGLLKVAKRVRVYCPFGDLLPGMAYLVRRLLENTANESFLRQSFVENLEVDKLLENPVETLSREREKAEIILKEKIPVSEAEGPDPFANEPVVDFTRPEMRAAFPEAVAQIRTMLGRIYPLIIGGQQIKTEHTISSVNPANPSEIVGQICQASTTEIDLAIEAAKEAFPAWRDTSPPDRAKYLFRAADLARQRIFTLAAWQVLEVGKQWDQAHADVGEAIDFLEYYGREMIRLGSEKRLGRSPGELNHYLYQPKGLAGVIAPWNFPLAISCGMSSAAMVAGNCVIYKPSNLSAVVGYTLAEIFSEAGIPKGVFNYTPGRGNVMGDYLVDHPDISIIAFTGSMEVGLRIVERAAKVRPLQTNVKRVIAEMGGKNAIIVDDDADLDEAVVHVVHAAFGFQGQKCSACSRAIVLEPIYEKFIRRLVEAAGSLRIGPPEDPANFMGPVVDGTAQERIMDYIEIGKREGNLLISREVPEDGYYVPLTVFDGIRPDHRLAQEEIFGPVLSIMKAKTFDEAIELANSTSFALTGGVFSRSPRNLRKARESFRVGNLYLNRGITGALVGRQPFGGFKMSGVGSKAGGPDYLIQFMDPRSVTENTMRRGFAPVGEEDDWI
ncbi:MAG: L-glutamate gamma-semialdehyde dehydrogenase [Deltaproteobacteria bacterium]|nr:MAG: L-glutamate gamma-semialdehyde dehydrogenase [Deltaproteobacteria bacterium]